MEIHREVAMTPIFVNMSVDGALLEDVPVGPASLRLTVGERQERCLRALLVLESYEVSIALGAVFLAGVHHGRQEGVDRSTVPDLAPPSQSVG
jgi:hypothetical protein